MAAKLTVLKTFLIATAVIFATSFSAFGLTLTAIDFNPWETSYHSAEIWDPLDWMGLTGAGNIDGAHQLSDGAKFIMKASTMSLMQWWQFWRIGSSTNAHDTWHWTSVYQLDGDAGQRASVSLDYELWSSYVLMAFDGFARSNSKVNLHYRFDEGLSPTSVPLEYNKEIYMLGLTFSDNTRTGSLTLGDMLVGDYLFLSGDVTASVKTSHYYAGLVAAAMVTSFDYSLRVTELPPDPVPEPAGVLVLGVGLVGLAFFGQRRFRAKAPRA